MLIDTMRDSFEGLNRAGRVAERISKGESLAEAVGHERGPQGPGFYPALSGALSVVVKELQRKVKGLEGWRADHEAHVLGAKLYLEQCNGCGAFVPVETLRQTEPDREDGVICEACRAKE